MLRVGFMGPSHTRISRSELQWCRFSRFAGSDPGHEGTLQNYVRYIAIFFLLGSATRSQIGTAQSWVSVRIFVCLMHGVSFRLPRMVPFRLETQESPNRMSAKWHREKLREKLGNVGRPRTFDPLFLRWADHFDLLKHFSDQKPIKNDGKQL